jgi:hypothetical protein
MIRRRSIRCFVRFASVALAGLLLVGGERLPGGRAAHATGCCGASIGDMTLFDPTVLGVDGWRPVYFDPFIAGFGGYLPDFANDELVADWHTYLGDAVTAADWKAVLFEASASDLWALHDKLTGKAAQIPKSYAGSSLWRKPDAKAKLAAAIAVVQLARAVEPSAVHFEPWDQVQRPLPTTNTLAVATTGMAASGKDAFLAQRYAFQAVRIYFYRGDFAGLEKFHEDNAAVLAAPSPGLAWRARYYLAGALAHDDQRARADLELARIHANYPPLAGAAAGDFHPHDDAEWRGALKVAKTTREKTELWRLVGVKFDGVQAMREIVALDPKSDLLALLVVRELAKTESFGQEFGGGDPALEQKAHAAASELEQLVLKLATTPGVDRPWLLELVAGDLTAKRGDLAATRTHASRAMQLKPNDAHVASQANASVALALVANWKIDPSHERELASLMGFDASYERGVAASHTVRDALAPLYAAANNLVDAEYLHPGTADGADESDGFVPRPGKLHWADVKFIQAMIARLDQRTTEFDRFVVDQDTLVRPRLEQELGIRQALDGDFAAAVTTFKLAGVLSTPLEVDPFVTHIKDCRDCDETKYAKSGWTHASVIAKLAELAPKAAGTGDAAAQAAIAIGNALYNFTWYGNARRVLRGTHQDTHDARPATRWYKRAFDVAKSRELKAQAAYLAAKAERGELIDKVDSDGGSTMLPEPTGWFAQLKQYADTRYYKEVVKECGTFRSWLAR